jgi:hypothetical protein
MKERPIRYGSVCSGIGGCAAAWHPLGWETAFFAEIESFPAAVIEYHYAGVPNAGDFTLIKGDEYGPIELLVGGTPCQSFSVAGLRGGLSDDRGNLALEFLKLAGRTRPRWIVWENVPGVLSSESHDRSRSVCAAATFGHGTRRSKKWRLKTSTPQKSYTPSTASWPDFQNSGMGSPTEFLTLSISEFPKDAVASSLSDILETGELPQRYFLSATACKGILRRAEKRGKELPPQLEQALRTVAQGTEHEAAIPRTSSSCRPLSKTPDKDGGTQETSPNPSEPPKAAGA